MPRTTADALPTLFETSVILDGKPRPFRSMAHGQDRDEALVHRSEVDQIPVSARDGSPRSSRAASRAPSRAQGGAYIIAVFELPFSFIVGVLMTYPPATHLAVCLPPGGVRAAKICGRTP